MRQRAHQLIKRSLVTAAVCAAAGAGLLLPDIVQRRPIDVLSLIFAAATFAAALFLFWRAWRAADALGLGMETIRTGVLNLVADREAILPPELGRGQPPEIEAMLGSLTLYQDAIDRERRGPDRRLVTVLGALAGGVVVMTEQGQVSLLNNAARELLGAERARVGTSLFAALSRETVAASLARVARDGQPREALFERLDGVKLQGRIVPLPGDEGAVIIFPPVELERHRPGVQFDLELHDVPPVAEAPSLDTPLDDLPVLVVDTETTGLDVTTDRVVSIGAVCAHGSRLFKSRMLDDLVDPGVPIPTASTRIHGITDEMVSGARSFPEVQADLERLSRHRVMVGHNVPFDLTILRHECERHGRPWEHPVFVDTLRLASLLNPSLDRHDLETLADLYRIEIAGRHTALGDALVTAELYFRLLPRLQQQGFRTLGDLLWFHCAEAADVIAGQRDAGWITTQPEYLRPE
ncbi:MAG: PAS domain-containing protein [bacterium]|nr:PAS domain-containing protein [bacterium]